MVLTLRAARVNVGLSQVEAAKVLKISASSLAAYESGLRVPRWNVVDAMLKLYGLSIDELSFLPRTTLKA